MSELIKENDMLFIQQMAEKYNLSVGEFGKLLVNQTRRNCKRQFRVSDEEYENISAQARSMNLPIGSYCEAACIKFLENENIKKEYFISRTYGKKRDNRIAVSFKNELVEDKLIHLAKELNIEIGSLIRYCVLQM